MAQFLESFILLKYTALDRVQKKKAVFTVEDFFLYRPQSFPQAQWNARSCAGTVNTMAISTVLT